MSDRGFLWWLLLLTGVAVAANALVLVIYLTTPTIACVLFIVSIAATAAFRYRRELLAIWLKRRAQQAILDTARAKAEAEAAKQAKIAPQRTGSVDALGAREQPGKSVHNPMPVSAPVPAKQEKQCRLCKMMIDSKALICPHCRSKQPLSGPWAIGAVALALGVVIPVLVLCNKVSDSLNNFTPVGANNNFAPVAENNNSASAGANNNFAPVGENNNFAPVAENNNSAPAGEKSHDLGTPVGAWIMATQTIKKKLPYPSTADFPLWENASDGVKDLGEGRYSVKGWVDHQSVSGAKVRTRFSCQMVYMGANDGWQCESLVLN